MTKINLDLDLVQYELLMDLINTLEEYLQSDFDVTSKLIASGIYDDFRNQTNAKRIQKKLIDCQQLCADIKRSVKQQSLEKLKNRITEKKLG